MSSNKKIAKNAGFLYIRMLLITGVTLYTSRLVISALGVSDYGVYNIVGGIVTMFGFVNGAMASATQRYLSYDIGSGDLKKLNKTFSSSLTVHVVIATLILLIGETAGLWYINNKLVFPQDRIFAVNVVYQFSLLTLFVNIIQVPYNSLIIAYERMNIYAYVSIFEAILKLVVAICLLIAGTDKLILYSILTFLVTLVIRVIYQIYCRKHFPESKYKVDYDWIYLKELVSYSGWNLFGTLSLIGKNQGINLILNIFFGPIVNAAYGIAMQVQSSVTQFVSNFQSALNPQIIQNYANNKRERSLDLIFLGAKFSFFVMLLLTIPIILNADFILKFWLGKEVPKFTVPFLKISLLALLIDSISGPLATGVLAVGKIKKYQLCIGGLNLLVPPIVYVFLRLGYSPNIAFIILVGFSICSLALRVLFLKNYYYFSVWMFFYKVLSKILLVSITAAVISWLLFENLSVDSFPKFFLWIMVFMITQGTIILFLAIDKQHRTSILGFVRSKISKQVS